MEVRKNRKGNEVERKKIRYEERKKEKRKKEGEQESNKERKKTEKRGGNRGKKKKERKQEDGMEKKPKTIQLLLYSDMYHRIRACVTNVLK